ncbi:MAG: hypothetical protein AB1635_19680 [Acidobacteriota bacterium]
MRTLATAVIALAATSLSAAGLAFTAPPAWKTVPTSSNMRVAQFALPGAAGAADAELIVYYFGGSGGSVAANMDRWIGQMQQPDGRPSKDVAKQRTRTINGLTATMIDLTGTYIAEMTPGSPGRHNSPNYRLRAVVVETPRGPYFIKLTGPAATVASHERSFEQFLGTLRYTP